MTETINEQVEQTETEQTGDEPEQTPAEPETPETPTEPDETEETDQVPQPGPVSETDLEQVFEKAAKRAKTYMTAVPDILGASAADLLLCPRCTDFLPGWILPLQIKPVTPEQKIAVKQSIGELVEVELRQADDAFECGKCGGYGRVLTGSKKSQQAEAVCLECDGRGWVGARASRLAQLPQPPQQVLNGDEAPPPEPAPPTDPWGRTKDDPMYGVMPGYERD